MLVHINTNIKSGPWGGGNQFLKALKTEMTKRGAYAEQLEVADAVLFNGYQDLPALLKFRLKYGSRKKAVYRLGPVLSLHRGQWWKIMDKLTTVVVSRFADFIIFQSRWSVEQALILGFDNKKEFAVIHNAVDESVFYRNTDEKQLVQPIRLIYSSWSANLNKGFDYLKFLDEHLDFKKYSFTFIGNSPLVFKNIKVLKPMDSAHLADELRAHDIFVSPVKDDACSNAILEALACGLPVVALDSGGNREIIGAAGEYFKDEQSLLSAVDLLLIDFNSRRSAIKLKTRIETAEAYLRVFIDAVRLSGKYGKWHVAFFLAQYTLEVGYLKVKDSIFSFKNHYSSKPTLRDQL